MMGTSVFYTVAAGDNYIYLRDVLKFELKLSHSLLVRLKEQNRILVNGQVTLTNYKVQPGDVVEVDIGLEERSSIVPQYMPLDIIYEDKYFLVVNKSPGISVHPSKSRSLGTLANGVAYHLEEQGLNALIRPINRLDKDTSGLILIGKNQFAHQAIFRQQKQGTIARRYQAVVEGLVSEDRGIIDCPIALKDPDLRERIVDPSGKNAVTIYTVIKRYMAFTHLGISLETGRTHQIRVHLRHLGHPICGDILYGNPSELIGRQALHAGELRFVHPITGQQLEFKAPLPEDMQRLLVGIE